MQEADVWTCPPGERLNFNEAATVLEISAPALTRRIQRLEATLGLSLLERSTRQISVTAAGLRFLDRARAALAMLDGAIEATQDEAHRRTGHGRAGGAGSGVATGHAI